MLTLDDSDAEGEEKEDDKVKVRRAGYCDAFLLFCALGVC